MNIFLIILGLLINNIIIGFLTQNLYDKKGYENGFAVGFLLGIYGLLYTLGLPNESETITKAREEYKKTKVTPHISNGNYTDNGENQHLKIEKENGGEDFKICNKCGYQIFNGEDQCSNCGEKVNK